MAAMDKQGQNPGKPVEFARIALRSLAEKNAPPTPENYIREYRLAAGIPLEESGLWGADEETLQSVRAIVQTVIESSGNLVTGINKLNSDSDDFLSGIDEKNDPDHVVRLLRALTRSALSLKTVIDTTSVELADTRKQLAKVSAQLGRAEAMARTDPLTGLGNRRAAGEVLDREIGRAKRTGEVFSLAILDVDHFKRVNDQYGHAVGDRALIHVANVAKACLRDTDEIFRYGGEEFVVILPGAAAEGAHFVIDRIRSSMEKATFLFDGGQLIVRLSAGVAQFETSDSAESLMNRADLGLTQAKSSGRNKVLIASLPAK